MNCDSCTTYYPLGCFPHCSVIELDFTVPSDGTYKLEFHIGGIAKLHDHKAMLEGENLEFDTNCLNECAHTILKIYDEDGNLLTFSTGDCTYDGFEFKIEIVKIK